MWRYGCSGGGGGPSAIHTCLPGKAWSASPPCMDTRPWASHREKARGEQKKIRGAEGEERERGEEERKKVGVDGRIGREKQSGLENGRIEPLHTATKTMP